MESKAGNETEYSKKIRPCISLNWKNITKLQMFTEHQLVSEVYAFALLAALRRFLYRCNSKQQV